MIFTNGKIKKLPLGHQLPPHISNNGSFFKLHFFMDPNDRMNFAYAFDNLPEYHDSEFNKNELHLMCP